MHKNKMGMVSIIIIVLILLIVFLFIAYASFDRNRPQIVLPDADSSQEYTGEEAGESNADMVARVEITTDSVQNVIATLKRPTAYSQAITITTYWSGGSGTTHINSYVNGSLVRMDALLPDGQRRHTLRDSDWTYIWYGSGGDVYKAKNGAFSVDDELWIPTYEDLLEMDSDVLKEAGYESYQETDCIYAATTEDENGYAQRYWIGVDSGLLVAAERLQNGKTVYLMEALNVTVSEPSSEWFVLPDGTAIDAAAS